MAGIFDFFPKQGGGGVLPASDPGEAQSLALLNAMGPIGQAGTTRTAGPVGSIAQNLIPLFGAMIQAKAYQQAAAQQQGMQALERLKLEAETAKALRENEPKNLQQILAGRVQKGQPTDDVVALMKSIQKPPADTEINLVKQSLGEKAVDPQAVLDALAKQKQAEASGLLAAKTPAELDLERQKLELKQSMLKPPTEKQITAWTSGIASLNSLDSAITGLASTSKEEIGASMITHGMLSNDAIRDYQKFKNDWDNFRYGARGQSQAALERINQEIPSLGLAFVAPDKFLDGLRKVRDSIHGQLAMDVDASSKTIRVPEEIQKGLGAIGQNQSLGLVPKRPGQPVEVDQSLQPTMLQNLQKLQKAGYSREEAKQIIYKQMGIAPDGTIPSADSR